MASRLEFAAKLKRIPVYPAAEGYAREGELAKLASNDCSDSRMVKMLKETWIDKGVHVGDRYHDEAVKFLPRFGKANRQEAIDVLALYGNWPEVSQAYAPMITHFSDRVRESALDRLMKLDPSGKIALAAVREAMKEQTGGHDYRLFEPLRRIGEPAIPLLIEMSFAPNLDHRLAALKAMRSADGKFNQAAAERAVDLYLQGASELPYSEYERNRFDGMIRDASIDTLRAMGDRGNAMAADLLAGRRPVSTSRQRPFVPLKRNRSMPPSKIIAAGSAPSSLPFASLRIVSSCTAATIAGHCSSQTSISQYAASRRISPSVSASMSPKCMKCTFGR